MRAAFFQRILLSPHPDDIAWSCYGSIHNPPVPSLEGILMVTVFSVSRTAPMLPLDQRNQEEISAIRQAEDKAFAKSEGCQLMFLGHRDSSVRGEPNEGLEAWRSDSTKHPSFPAVKASILKAIGPAVGHASIYVPLGIRDHIDHRMVRDATKQIIMEANIPGIESSLIYYEDLPYAAFLPEHQIRSFARSIISPTARSIEVSLKSMWVRKKNAMQLYRSQLKPFTFKTISNYASQLGGSSFAQVERLWVDDPRTVRPKVDIMTWVTWEAARRIGGYTTLFKHVFESKGFQEVVGRTILMGPMHMPINCPEYDPSEDIESIASTLGSEILYPVSLTSGPTPLSNATVEAFRNIEKRYEIGIYYLRDKDSTYSHAVDRVLFDLSGVLDQKNIYMTSLPKFCRDLKEYMNIPLDINIRRRTPATSPSVGSGPRSQYFDTSDNYQMNVWKKNLSNKSPSFYGHQDSDSVYGMVLAQPVADCLRALVEPDESAVLIATEELSLPSAYATQMANRLYSSLSGPLIKTMFYGGDVHPIRNLTTGAVSPDVPSLDTVSGFAFEGPIRLLIEQCLQGSVKNSIGNTIPRYHLQDFPPLQEIASHVNTRIMQNAWKVDSVTVTSTKVRDELTFLNPQFASIKEIPIISPGVSNIPCDAGIKELSRAKLISYARIAWDFEDLTVDNTIVATQIARGVTPKGFLRTLQLVRELSQQLKEIDQSDFKVLCVFVTSWDAESVRDGDYRIIDELLKALGGTTTLHADNLYVKVINEPLWPIEVEQGALATRMSREDLHRATDLSICLSLYDTFAIAPLEPMSCGSIAVISTGCGCFRKILELENWTSNVVVVDYLEDWAIKQNLATRSVISAPPVPSSTATILSEHEADEHEADNNEDENQESQESQTTILERIKSRTAPTHLPSQQQQQPLAAINPIKDLDLIYTDLNKLFQISHAEKHALERAVHKSLARDLLHKLPRTAAQRAALMHSGRALADHLNWDSSFSRPFAKAISDLFSS